ncbi:helix-turn-helix domain-containing protein [Enterobacter hormaechei]|uniref:helix-turn-helix domain-containing protein n=1 Tax=Enterobacter hormaechei TaxID=158836 RepID=UPI0029645CE4|nr:helix-turn-helix domain-containing protein [Enterobacter hormaechei]MDW2601531.1 helix-turn-helix domain-containing protein [Enterobacter hormaechei]
MRSSVTMAVLEQIEKHLEENIEIESLAAMTGYSRRRLQDFFKQKCGVSIGKYIRQRRLCRSATLLKLTSESVTDIALRLGFDSVQSYSREFKKMFGVSPKSYRQEKFWDLTNLRAPYWLVPDVEYPFEICQLPAFTVHGFQTRHQIASESLPKEASPLKWKFVMDTLEAWEQTVFCISSFGPEPDNVRAINVTSFFGIQGEASKTGPMPLTRQTEGGKYAKFKFSGTWEDYQHFSNTIYLSILPKHQLRRTWNKDEIEIFYYCGEDVNVQKASIRLEYYIPVE